MHVGLRRKIFSILFSSIFVLKMVISAAPIYADLYDSKQVIAVILQLEIENHSAKTNCCDLPSENFSKEIATVIDWNIFLTPIRYLSIKSYIADDDISVKSFYPSVPTPPPNC
ncbi:hypothetical protein [Olivibacter domesticus]|uniref:Uncharacterized protein n=1 Tax=Olivibacter domesticus TaxID=407022 RepID=A0A1H7LGQ9_OLID1|nr:hypothetical protein [Olivibacter domesticus]SEK98132.1 hypothetical protein SAMN05661044_01668 [Olivibacter domesticus]